MIVKFENLIKQINFNILQKRGDYRVLQKILDEKTEKNNGNME